MSIIHHPPHIDLADELADAVISFSTVNAGTSPMARQKALARMFVAAKAYKKSRRVL